MKWDGSKFYVEIDRARRRIFEHPNLSEVESEAVQILLDELRWLVLDAEPRPIGHGLVPDQSSVQLLRDVARELQEDRRARSRFFICIPFDCATEEEVKRSGGSNVVCLEPCGGTLEPEQ